ncbi:NUDIX hydrolase [Bacillus mesophilum]|uniref:NUDIX hydrolase n=1 Tax=Bacillus mesophilum TaxID=1071718 RepID=A0A7V7UTV7_9BACI|nr:NUDIX hydrolase [Bacillus mesophilum]KAB2331259.1 NUDIX hydrolase [Bacillus mesophilum]
MNKWKTLKTEYIHKSPFGHIRKDACQLPNGHIIHDYYVHEYANWVNAVVITKEKQLVMVEQYRYAGEGFFLEVPAGKIEAHETDEEGIIREVQEETGFTSLRQPILLGEFMVNPAIQNNKIKTFLLLEACRTSEQKLDDTEEMSVQLIDFDQFEEMIVSNTIQTQLFTAHAYYMAKSYLK